MAQTPVVIALTPSGLETARRSAAAIGGTVHGRAGRVAGADQTFDDTLEHLRALFAAGIPIVGICASGILIRALAPLLSDKRAEPPVIAVADDGSAVVPLLGGHRGANRLARSVAEALQVRPAITTAGDVALGVALDDPPPGYRLVNPHDAGPVTASLLSGAGARITGDDIFGLGGSADGDVDIAVSAAPLAAAPGRLVYAPQIHTLGLGCARRADPAALWAHVETTLAEAGIAPASIASVNTVALKADEPAILAVAERLDVPLRLFSAAELEAETPRLATPSQVVFAEIGCHGVAEAAALAAAGAGASLVVPKRKTAEATCALARAPAPMVDLPGRPRGRLAVIGIGPGQSAWRTPEAARLIAEADELVGYGLYIDLLGPLAAGKRRTDFALGEEEARCRHALERAGEGAKVALVCSGDAGIYAMAAPVFELLDRPGAVSDDARRAEIVCAPGISALQAAAARAGAPLGHDFCAISLSDLLTPRDDILRRVEAAATGDFVVALYNPVSRRRRTLLAETREILLRHRPADTPVVLAASLGRAEESVRFRRLADLAVDDVDMLTVVLIGSSQSRAVTLGEGPRVYTPRGYARKHADATAPADAGAAE